MSRRVGLRHMQSVGALIKVNVTVDDSGCGHPLCPPDKTLGTIRIDGVDYQKGDVAQLTLGDHTLVGITDPEGWCYLGKWETEGDVSVADPYAGTTTLTVNGEGTIRLIQGYVL